MKPRGAKSCLSLADSRLRRRVREPITGTSRRKWGKGSWEDTSEYPGDRVLLLLLIKVTSLVCHLPPSINPPVKTHSLIHIQIMLKHRLRLWQWDWNPVSLFTWRRGQISLCVPPPPQMSHKTSDAAEITAIQHDDSEELGWDEMSEVGPSISTFLGT